MTDYTTTTPPATQAQLAAFFTVILVFALVFTFLYALPLIIINWKLYKKAGRPGWNAIVPVYGYLVMAEIGEKPAWMGWTAGLLPFLAFFASGLLKLLVNLVLLVFVIMLLVAFFKKFDRGVGFWVLVVLLPIVAVFMIKDVNYKGGTAAAPPSQPAPPAQPTPPAPAAPGSV